MSAKLRNQVELGTYWLYIASGSAGRQMRTFKVLDLTDGNGRSQYLRIVEIYNGQEPTEGEAGFTYRRDDFFKQFLLRPEAPDETLFKVTNLVRRLQGSHKFQEKLHGMLMEIDV